jgi:eukaryotic translation initiation factor 2C
MIQVPSNHFDFPTLEYGNYTTEKAKDRWNTKDKAWFQCKSKTFNVFVLADAQMEDHNRIRTGCRSFEGFAGPPKQNSTNYSVATVNYRGGTHSLSDARSENEMRVAIDKARRTNPDINFLLLILGKKDAEAYARFKNLADRTYGFHSVCMTERILMEKIGEKMGNIMMKANLKTGGINHTIDGGILSGIMADTLILGADVTHPLGSSIFGCPSVAAIVGSVDSHAGRFLGSMRLQDIGKKEVRVESG